MIPVSWRLVGARRVVEGTQAVALGVLAAVGAISMLVRTGRPGWSPTG